MLRKKQKQKKRNRPFRPNTIYINSSKKENQQKLLVFIWRSYCLNFNFIIIFWDNIFPKTYKYCFVDADRDTSIHSSINIKVIKENESPIHYTVKPKELPHYDKRQNAKDGGFRTTL